MFESTSPFDDALAKPFLDEPVKKRWSMQTQTDSPSSTKSSASACWTLSGSSSSSSSSRNNDAPVHYLEYQAPDLEEIDFDNQDGNDEELGLLMTPDDLDFAIIRERHQDISEINSSLLQINEIQKDLAVVVDSQGQDIHEIETMAIESLDQTSSGISHLLSMQAKLRKSSKEHKRLYTSAIALLLLVCAHWLLSSRFGRDENGIPKHS